MQLFSFDDQSGGAKELQVMVDGEGVEGIPEYIVGSSSPIMNCSTASLAKELKFEGIKTISGSIEFDFNYGKNNDGEDQNIESVSFPELVHITGKVTVKQTRGLTSVSLEKLTNATTIQFESNEALASFSAPELTYTLGGILMKNNSALSTVVFPKLGEINGLTTLDGGLTVYNNPKLTKVDAPLLTRTGDVVVGYMVSYECAS